MCKAFNPQYECIKTSTHGTLNLEKRQYTYTLSLIAIDNLYWIVVVIIMNPTGTTTCKHLIHNRYALER